MAGLPGSHRKRAAGLGPGLLTPVQCPPHHTHFLPPMAERLLGLVSPGLSLSPVSSPDSESSRGPTPRVSGGWGTHQLHNALGRASERLFPCRHSQAAGPLPQPVLRTSSPSIWCSILSLPSSDPALQRQLLPWVRPHLVGLFQFPQGKEVRKGLLLQEQEVSLFPGGLGKWVLESESLSLLP